MTRRGTVVRVPPCTTSQTYSFRDQLLVSVAIAIALATANGQAAPYQGTQANYLGAQQTCAAQANVYFRERREEAEKLAKIVPGWTVSLNLGAPPYSPATNHYNQKLHRCLVAISRVENDKVKDKLTTDVTPRLTRIEIVDPFEQASVLTCSDPIPTHLTDTRTGKTSLLPSSRGWKCRDGDDHQLNIDEGVAMMSRLMRE